jgi:hypothetical protein
LRQNPTYYEVEDISTAGVNRHMSLLIDSTFKDLADNGCIEIDDAISPTIFGRITSFYYLDYKTVGLFKRELRKEYTTSSFSVLLRLLADAHEFDEIPVRHNEDLTNKELEMVIPVKVAGEGAFYTGYDNPHVKVFLLLQCHLTRGIKFSSTDYVTDSNTCLDSSIRILQAMIDVAASEGWLDTTTGVVNLLQCVKQAMWPTDSQLFCLPHVNRELVEAASKIGIVTIKDALKLGATKLSAALGYSLTTKQVKELVGVLIRLPIISTNNLELYNVDGDEAELAVDGVLNTGGACILQFDLRRTPGMGGGDDIPLYCPRFPKGQNEGWIVLLGDGDGGLVFLKRVGKGKVRLEFVAPARGKYEWRVSVLSDGYVGVDAGATVKFSVQ